MELSSIHHVALIAGDYERSKDFYTRILGFKVAAEHHREERRSYKLDLVGENDMRLELFSFPEAPARMTNPEACGLRHLAFRVRDLDGAIRELARNGVTCEDPRIDEYTGRRFAFFRDPDDLPLELYEEREPG